VAPSAFHPKLYLVRRAEDLTVFSGYEELRMKVGSTEADQHARRFEALWRLGVDLSELRETGAWDDYRDWADVMRERYRRDIVDDRRAAARIRARVRATRGHSLAGRRSDPAGTTFRPTSTYTTLRDVTWNSSPLIRDGWLSRRRTWRFTPRRADSASI
jgi:hypothetical protein